MKKQVPEGYWDVCGYSNEYMSGILTVVTKVDSMITQEYQPIMSTARQRLKCMNWSCKDNRRTVENASKHCKYRFL